MAGYQHHAPPGLVAGWWITRRRTGISLKEAGPTIFEGAAAVGRDDIAAPLAKLALSATSEVSKQKDRERTHAPGPWMGH
jgi:hypothetical protein